MDPPPGETPIASGLTRSVPDYLHIMRHPVRGANYINKLQMKSVHRSGNPPPRPHHHTCALRNGGGMGGGITLG